MRLLTLRHYHPSEVWWRSWACCLDETERAWYRQAAAAGLVLVGELTVAVALDVHHPHRLRTVTVAGRASPHHDANSGTLT